MNRHTRTYSRLRQRLGALMALLAVVSGMAVSSCDSTIHEYPDAPCSNNVRLAIIPIADHQAPPVRFRELTYSNDWKLSERPLSPEPSPNFAVPADSRSRIVLEVLRIVEDRNGESHQLVSRRVVSLDAFVDPLRDTVSFSLPEGRYKVLAWSDLHTEAEVPYSADDLRNIRYDFENMPLPPDRKAALCASLDVTLSRGTPNCSAPASCPVQVVEMHLSRPTARYSVIATGGCPYSGPVTAKVVYRQYVSVGYNTLTAETNSFVNQYSFNCVLPVVPTAHQELEILADHILVADGKVDYVKADFYFFDAAGRQISCARDIEIPLRASYETVLRGPFLNSSVTDGGDVSIDDNFAGEIIVPLRSSAFPNQLNL
ncbi:MAG: DUF6562 domain-containing protein [Muribaculaceae bacterium]|nr:DUF6562 domain-containing protein [Muribaculaceae bacterium]